MRSSLEVAKANEAIIEVEEPMEGAGALYSYEKLSLAVDALRQKGPYTERLEAAFRELVALRPRDLPANLQGDFESIKNALTSVEASGNEGRLRATLSQMSDRDAQAIGERLIDLRDTLRGQLGMRR